MNEDTLYIISGQKKLEDEYRDANVLPKINKSDMARTMEAIKKYLRLCIVYHKGTFCTFYKEDDHSAGLWCIP